MSKADSGKRIPPDEWAIARQAWEADPIMNFGTVAERLGISRQAVNKKAVRDGWTKVISTEKINQAAIIKADNRSKLNGEVDEGSGKKSVQASIEQATELRSQLLMSHRAEWRRHAKMYSIEELNQKPFDESKKAKISAEMISIRQRAERTAWGMDEKDTPQQTNKGVVLVVGDREVSAKDLGWA